MDITQMQAVLAKLVVAVSLLSSQVASSTAATPQVCPIPEDTSARFETCLTGEAQLRAQLLTNSIDPSFGKNDAVRIVGDLENYLVTCMAN